MSSKWSFLLSVGLVLSLTGRMQCFEPLFASGSLTHKDITIRAIVQKTAEVCRDIAAVNGQDFSLTIDDSLTIEQVLEACFSSSSLLSSFQFNSAIAEIFLANAFVDRRLFGNVHHFDDEAFQGGRDIITRGVADVKDNVRRENFDIARFILGMTLHTLQAFYSHSNWVELGNLAPYSVLIRPDQPLDNLAGIDVPTCRNCDGDNCDDNILPNVLANRLLTSGYFSLFSSAKPDGKCSHGGLDDRTSRTPPIGGINKNTIGSEHGSLHNQAANLAITATMELLEDIRIAGGDKNFLRLMGLSQTSVLCFVIDTTGSMIDEIAEVRRLSAQIVESRRGTILEPPAYILVPFNDPTFGPLLRTSDADFFIDEINRLRASGGGDLPEFSLSGLQLALTGAPPLSEIFVFTDAAAKDAFLRNTVIALIEERKSVVTFILTNILLPGRRKRDVQNATSRILLPEALQLYRDIARASGGETIEVRNSPTEFALATSVIEESLRSATVIVFQEESSKSQTFQFTIDNSLQNVIISITGNPDLTFNLTSSTGVTQNSSESSGPLASFILVGTLHRLRLNNDSETGLWKISVDSEDPFLVRITGQSPVNFIYNLVEPREGLTARFFPFVGRPFSGSNVTALITLTGRENETVSEVTLFDSAGPTEVIGTSEFLGGTDYLVTFNEIPDGDFVLRLRGTSNSSKSTANMFQRQAATQISTSNVSVTAQVNITIIEPGSTIFIPFTVCIMSRGVINETTDATFTVRATNDRGFESSPPMSITVQADSGGKANGTVSLTVPESAESGTDVTLTIEVQNEVSADINFAVVRFGVANMSRDITQPVCMNGRVTGNCSVDSSMCNSSQWSYVVEVTDGVNGTGIAGITIRQGNGTLNTSTVSGPGGENITVASYQASCCADRVALAAVDNTGNVGVCMAQVADLFSPMCLEVSTSSCPTSSSPCSSSQWEYVVDVTGVNGVSRENVTILLGDGTLTTSTVAGQERRPPMSRQFQRRSDSNSDSKSDSNSNVTTNSTGTGGHTVSTTLHVWIPVVILPLLRCVLEL
nr:von Willebrand factor A domain-containing protein 7-like [Nerophis lumbriciformis]